ncbi:hypothetical protein KC865_02850 [Candidatus Kaiserbacteria bacterium]|nr:hypothetical protein [Candidatus Kaiserbacteria bacterium]
MMNNPKANDNKDYHPLNESGEKSGEENHPDKDRPRIRRKEKHRRSTRKRCVTLYF